MFKRVFSFILIMVMLVCTITAEAKDVYFATHRSEQSEYGEWSDTYCPTRIELDIVDTKTLVIKTKTRGTVSYTFNDIDSQRDATNSLITFYDADGYKIGDILFKDTDWGTSKPEDFWGLVIYRKNGTRVVYLKSEQY